VLPGLALVALGNGLAYAPTFVLATSDVDERDQGLASGLIGTSQELGTAVGLAVIVPLAAAVAGSTATVDGHRAGIGVAAVLAVAALALTLRTPPHLGLAPPADDAPSEPEPGATPRSGSRVPVPLGEQHR
jgi:hypothetical protein